jgi:hypothetical protein
MNIETGGGIEKRSIVKLILIFSELRCAETSENFEVFYLKNKTF